MNTVTRLDVRSKTKSKAALMTSAIALIIFQNLELASDVISIFGLEVVVSQESLVGVTKLTTAVLLVGFMLALVRTLPIEIARFLRRRDTSWWRLASEEMREFERRIDPSYDLDPPEDWDTGYYIERNQRHHRRQKILSYYRPVASFVGLAGEVFLPIALSIISLFFPSTVLVFA